MSVSPPIPFEGVKKERRREAPFHFLRRGLLHHCRYGCRVVCRIVVGAAECEAGFTGVSTAQQGLYRNFYGRGCAAGQRAEAAACAAAAALRR